MAPNNMQTNSDTVPEEMDSHEEENVQPNVEDFVTRHFNEQMAQPDPEVDQERRSDFFARAIAESQRMNKEVVKSHNRLAKLHNELGAETFNEWRTEHAAEVLLPEQIQAVEMQSQKTAQEMADT